MNELPRGVGFRWASDTRSPKLLALFFGVTGDLGDAPMGGVLAGGNIGGIALGGRNPGCIGASAGAGGCCINDEQS